MSGYSKMNDVGSFWKGLMALTGVLCLITLVLPTFYYIKYVAFDYPREQKLSANLLAHTNAPVTSPAAPVTVDRVRYYMAVATTDPAPARRIEAVHALELLCRIPHAQVLHWMESLNAKTTLSRITVTDKSQAVRDAATVSLERLGTRGYAFRR